MSSVFLTPEQHEELSNCVDAICQVVNYLRSDGANPGLVDTALVLVAGHSVNKHCPSEIRDEMTAQLTNVLNRMASGVMHDGPVQ